MAMILVYTTESNQSAMAKTCSLNRLNAQVICRNCFMASDIRSEMRISKPGTFSTCFVGPAKFGSARITLIAAPAGFQFASRNARFRPSTCELSSSVGTAFAKEASRVFSFVLSSPKGRDFEPLTEGVQCKQSTSAPSRMYMRRMVVCGIRSVIVS